MTMIIATVFKETRDMSTGLQLVNTDNKLMVKTVVDNGLFSFTDLRAGMEVVNINGESMEGKTASYASGKVLSALGEIWIAAKQTASVLPVHEAPQSTTDPNTAPIITATTVTDNDAERNQTAPQRRGVAGAARQQAVPLTTRSNVSDDVDESPGCSGEPLLAPANIASSTSNTEPEIQTAELVGEGPSRPQMERLVFLSLPPPRHLPPPGVAPGGVWGETRYCGPATICLGCVGVATAFIGGIGCIPRRGIDKKRVYAVGDMVYEENGRTYGRLGSVEFTPYEEYRRYLASMRTVRVPVFPPQAHDRMNRDGRIPVATATATTTGETTATTATTTETLEIV